MKIISLAKAQESNLVEKTIQNGGLVILPTDTVYGACVDATNPIAVSKLCDFKNRPENMPISVFLVNVSDLDKYVKISTRQKLLVKNYLPGPFTIIFDIDDKSTIIDQRILSVRKTIGIRISDSQFICDIVEKTGVPITATSANIHGGGNFSSVEALLSHLPKSKQKMIDLIVDGSTLSRSKGSTIIDLSQDKTTTIRVGDVIDSFLSHSKEETRKIACAIFDKFKEELKTNALGFILIGELGVGKTEFVKGIGKSLNIDDLSSPSYEILSEYKVKNNLVKKLIHADFYFIQDSEEIENLGILESLERGNLVLFEWGNKFKLQQDKINFHLVQIEKLGIDSRRINLLSGY